MCDRDNQNFEPDNQNFEPDNQNFESVSMDQTVTEEDIRNLLIYFSKHTYVAKSEDVEANNILHRAINLMKLDYSISIVSNNNGELTASYPSQLPILEYEIATNQNVTIGNTSQASQRTTDTIYESVQEEQSILDLINQSRFARCRARFPIPTILYRGKYVCRSSTLSGGPEMYGRSGLDYLFYGTQETSKEKVDNESESNGKADTATSQSEWPLFDKLRNHDIRLLKKLNVGTIVDLMVEKKKVKYGLNVTSSEKVDKERRYSDFNIMCLPYPGCEFFRFFSNTRDPASLVFDWSQEQCDASISVPDNPLLKYLKIDWNNYKEWDLLTMTQNYLRYLLKYLQDSNSGLLIHCISGWDRTPLFISLIRLSLWADGLIHQSLDEYQIMYLTIAYDWLLFGHHLTDRLNKGEEIFLYCFYVLKYLTGDEYSIAPGRYKIKKYAEKMAEDSVSKTEVDAQMELLLEQDLRGSNISLNSTSSTVSSKSQEPTTWYHHGEESNGNSAGYSLDVRDTLALGASASPQARRTSPVTVPMGTRLKRTESSTTTSSVHSTNSNNSSNSTGSWQVVTGTGSLRSSDSTCSGDIPFAQTSMRTIVDGDEWLQEINRLPSSGESSPLPSRKERMLKVRNCFSKLYDRVISRTPDNYGQPSLVTNISEKVGISQKP